MIFAAIEYCKVCCYETFHKRVNDKLTCQTHKPEDAPKEDVKE